MPATSGTRGIMQERRNNMAPDKIYVREYPDGINQFWDRKKRDDVVAIIYHEYIRKDALLEWAKKELENAEYTNFDEFGRGEVIAWRHIVDKLNKI